jgi:hypothetical protein
MIESAAENCAKNMKKAPNGQIDEASLMAGMNSMLAQMLGGGGGANPLAAMLGGAAPQPPPRTGKRKPTKKISQ